MTDWLTARNERGPRHFCLHPRLPMLYTTEQANTVLDVKVILNPLYTCISSVILHTKYTGRRDNDFNVYA